ncbi:MAG: glycosyltransferase [Terrimicrobiaceae bacterium]
MLASIVIRTFNEARHLGGVLDAVSVQTVPGTESIEVIVVDSGSTDGTLEIAASAGAKILNIRREDFTFGRSLNMGCDAAKGEFLILLSGHCIPYAENWLTELLHPFQDPSIAISYGRQVGGKTTRFSESRVFEKYYPAAKTSQGPAFCNNANCAVRKSIWRRFRYDETLTGLEDIDLGKKVVREGFRIIYAPAAPVIHIHDETWGQVRRRYEREAIALRHIHPEFHFGIVDAVLYFLAAVFNDTRAIIKQRASLATLQETAIYRFHQFLGSWEGNRPHRELSSMEKIRYFFPA